MFEFKYNIELDEDGIPYISLPDDFENKPEHSFMISELSLYMFYDLKKRSEKRGDPIHIVDKLEETITFLHEICDNLSLIIRNQMSVKEEIDDILNNDDNKDELNG